MWGVILSRPCPRWLLPCRCCLLISAYNVSVYVVQGDVHRKPWCAYLIRFYCRACYCCCYLYRGDLYSTAYSEKSEYRKEDLKKSMRDLGVASTVRPGICFLYFHVPYLKKYDEVKKSRSNLRGVVIINYHHQNLKTSFSNCVWGRERAVCLSICLP